MSEHGRYQSINEEEYGDSYFDLRRGNNCKRNRQFDLDGAFITQKKSKGVICDVGCSTGEFLDRIGWEGEKYGLEVNMTAIAQAKKNGINFEKNIFTESNFFDVVVFRGTIQHIDEPFRFIKAAHKSLKKDGIIVFLATPNAESLVYRLKNNLPFLHSHLNFYIPGKNSLCNALQNIGFGIEEVETPYWNTPYRKFPRDLILFCLNVLSSKFYRHAFWGNTMSIIASKI